LDLDFPDAIRQTSFVEFGNFLCSENGHEPFPNLEITKYVVSTTLLNLSLRQETKTKMLFSFTHKPNPTSRRSTRSPTVSMIPDSRATGDLTAGGRGAGVGRPSR